MLLEIHPKNPNPHKVKQAVDILNKDGIVIFPTDSIYAAGCRFDNKKAIEKLCKLSGKKSEKAEFSLLFNDLSSLSEYSASLEKSVFRLIKKNTPGPFTFILEIHPKVKKQLQGNRKTIGIRIPDNEIVKTLITELGVPLVSTSIHSDDQIIEYMTEPVEIYEKFDRLVDCVIDGGTGGNQASTIVDCSDGQISIIRQGVFELIS